MKRNIQAFWLEATPQGQVRAVILRDRQNRKEIPLYVYLPTPSSLKRINEVARGVVREMFSTYECSPIDDNEVTLGWVLNRKMDTVYPPPDNHVVWYVKNPPKGILSGPKRNVLSGTDHNPMGTQNAGQNSQPVPNEATTP